MTDAALSTAYWARQSHLPAASPMRTFTETGHARYRTVQGWADEAWHVRDDDPYEASEAHTTHDVWETIHTTIAMRALPMLSKLCSACSAYWDIHGWLCAYAHFTMPAMSSVTRLATA